MALSKKIVIGFTPFHALFAERLIASIKGDVYCVFTKGWPAGYPYKRLACFLRSRFLYKISYVASFVYFLLVVRFWMFKGVRIEVYVPHPKNIFSNFLFFSRKVAVVNIYEDGLLNYYDAPAEKAKVKGFLRLVSWLCGASFQEFSGHLAGYDTCRVSGLYVSRESKVVARDKVKEVIQVVSDSKPVVPVAGRILFLDQDVSSFFSLEERAKIVDVMLRLYPLDAYTYYYKAHHDFKDNSLAMNQLEENLEGLPAESIVGELQPQLVVSFFSSALLNIAVLHSNVKCISLAAEYVHVARDGVPCLLSELFRDVGVKCLSDVDK
jgi:hypothetical protein